MKPDERLIDSMSMRYRHDFGLLDEQTKNSIRTTMLQLWEEVVGLGFYKYKEIQPTWDDVRKAIHMVREIKYVTYSEDEIIETIKQSKK